MELPATQQEILAHLGVANLAAASSPKRFGYEYTITFGDNIAAGGSSIKTVTVDNDGFFVVLAKSLLVWNPSTTGGGAVARTPAALLPSPKEADNTWMTLASFDIEIQTQAHKWSGGRVNAAAICGTGASPAFEIVPRVIPPGQVLQATLTNNSAFTVQGVLVFYGYRLLRN